MGGFNGERRKKENRQEFIHYNITKNDFSKN